MNTQKSLFSAYVTSVGGRAEAAKRLGLSTAMVGHLVTGARKVSPAVAIAVDRDSNGHFNRAAFRPDLWGAPANTD